MVSAETLNTRFRYEDGNLYWRNGRMQGTQAGYVRESDGYSQINFTLNGCYTRMLAHRIIFCLFHDYLPDLVDHIDRNPRNNRIENLRESDKSGNALNTQVRKNNSTGVKGVWKDKRGKYQASVFHKGKKLYLGTYDEIEQAKLRIEGWKRFYDVR
jgi:hypothetical protein